MNNKTRFITKTERKTLHAVGQAFSYDQLLEVVNEAIKWSPPLNMLGVLCKVYRREIPLHCWNAVCELEVWGGAITQHDLTTSDQALLASAEHLEPIIAAFKMLVDTSSGAAEEESQDLEIAREPTPTKKRRHRSEIDEDFSCEPR
ncbi:hypothetical protein [Halopseudomonas sp.]|uniref:hypothetical protein n=1 Tax=Halopseudomonas sp. TaxID=2901191 RepID=UPI00300280FB